MIRRQMGPRLAMLLLLATALIGATTIKLYLQGGGDLLVREYEVVGERVRYYSVERRQWEEIPLKLVDLDKTQEASARQQRRLESMRAESSAELAAERKARTELHNVPTDSGIYLYQNDKATALAQQEVFIDGSKRRKFLQVLTGTPIMAGKKTLHIEGSSAELAVTESKPIFYIRQPDLTMFGIVRVTAEKARRVVQIAKIVPQVEEVFEQQEDVEIFRQQIAPGVYRVWPIEPLPEGEYAVVDFTPGALDLRVWSFRIAASPSAADPSS